MRIRLLGWCVIALALVGLAGCGAGDNPLGYHSYSTLDQTPQMPGAVQYSPLDQTPQMPGSPAH